MSYYVGEAYSSALRSNEFNKELIGFSGLRFELSDKLLNEFVAPIERNDIYNLSYHLNEEMHYVGKLNNILRLVDLKSFKYAESLVNVFHKQNEIFSAFFREKNNNKTLKQINDCKGVLNGINTSIILSVKSVLKSSEQPLLQYIAVSCFSELFKSVEKTFSEVERVIINNS